VLYNLRKAYGNMDADAYVDGLAEDFIFYLNPDDLTGNPTLPEYWGRAAETTIHENMF
jgi:ketosteroid isomerase-like protein